MWKNNPPAISLVVPTLARKKPLVRLFESLEVQLYKNFEVVLVDQNPQGYLEEILDRFHNSLSINYIRVTPEGVSKARNAGLKEVKGDIIAFPDDDCWYKPETLQTVVACFAGNNGAKGIVGTWFSPGSEDRIAKQPFHFQKINRWRAFFKAGTIVQFYTYQVISEVGLFDTRLGPGTGLPFGCGEDTDYLLRALERHMIFRCPAVEVLHDQPQQGGADMREKQLAYGAGRMYLLRKHRFPLWFKIANIMYPLGCFFLEAFRNRAAAEYRRAMFMGRLKGFFARP